MEMDQRYSGLTKLGFGVLACNSALAVYNSRGDVGSVAFVLVADAALVLLLVSLIRELERRRGRLKAAVWALTTLLTGMFAARVAPLMPQRPWKLWSGAWPWPRPPARGLWALFFS